VLQLRFSSKSEVFSFSDAGWVKNPDCCECELELSSDRTRWADSTDYFNIDQSTVEIEDD
jgi:hypothetical protein